MDESVQNKPEVHKLRIQPIKIPFMPFFFECVPPSSEAVGDLQQMVVGQQSSGYVNWPTAISSWPPSLSRGWMLWFSQSALLLLLSVH